uniref:Putative ATPase domain containing protein n=2 Tax=viral metagenome TaxID=1070528 RepID=A0A6M3M6M3_9ZZZZ
MMFQKLKQLKINVMHRRSKAVRITDEKRYWNQICRQIAPTTIEELSTNLIINNNEIVVTIVLGVPPIESNATDGFPKRISDRLTDQFQELKLTNCTLAISSTLIPIPPHTATDMVEHAVFYNLSAQETAQQNNPRSRIPRKLRLDEEALEGAIKELHDREQNLFFGSYILTIHAPTSEDLRGALGEIIQVIESNRLLYEIPDYRHMQTFLASLPTPTVAEHTLVNPMSSLAAKLLCTRSPDSRMDEQGLWLGKDMKTSNDVIVDLNALVAKHFLFIGSTGGGKTYTFLLWLMRMKDMLGMRVIYTTPKSDPGTQYTSCAEYYGDEGSIIDVGRGKYNINPLQIIIDATTMTTTDDYIRAYDNHKDLLESFFRVLYGTELTANMEAHLDVSLNIVYKSKGIKRDIPSTWENADWPNMIDLRSIWESEASDNVSAKALHAKTHKFGEEGAWNYVNKPTDINLSADFIIIDFSGTPSGLQDAMNVLITGILSTRFRNDSAKETFICIDEGRVYLKNPRLAEFIMTAITQGRSAGVWLGLATQQPADLTKYGMEDELKSNMQGYVVFGHKMNRDTIDHVSNFFKLSKHDEDDLMSCGVGEGLLIIGDQVIPTKFEPTTKENEIIKGKYKQEITVIDSVIVDNSDLYDIAMSNGLYADSWISIDSSDIMADNGFIAKQVQNPVGKGQTKVWIDSNILDNGMIANQTIDHYSTVMLIAGYLVEHGFDVEINHFDDVDIFATKNNHNISIEYEMPRSHTAAQLLEKRDNSINTHGNVIFVMTSENEKFVKKTLGNDICFKRGNELVTYLDNRITEIQVDNMTR